MYLKVRKRPCFSFQYSPLLQPRRRLRSGSRTSANYTQRECAGRPSGCQQASDPVRLHPRRKGAPEMSDLVVITYPTEAKAEEVRQKLLAMQKEYLIELSDAVIAVKDANDRIKLNQLLNTTAAGA